MQARQSPELSPSVCCDMKPKVAAATVSGGDKGRGVDPLLPRFKCQECHRALVVIGVESFPERLPAHANSGTFCALIGFVPLFFCEPVVTASIRIERTFVVII